MHLKISSTNGGLFGQCIKVINHRQYDHISLFFVGRLPMMNISDKQTSQKKSYFFVLWLTWNTSVQVGENILYYKSHQFKSQKLFCKSLTWWLHCKYDWKQYIHIFHYDDVIMSTIASQITSLTIVYSTVYSGADQSKHQSSASLAFVWGIHRGPVNSPHKWPVTRKMFPFDDVIMHVCCRGFETSQNLKGSKTSHH